MNILNYLTGTAKEAADVIAKGPKPTDLEIALARIHSDHTTSMVAVKLLTESVQSMAAGNLDMVVVHQERHKALLDALRDLKKAVAASEGRHLAAFEISLRPSIRALADLRDKVNGLSADIHAIKTELYMDREAQARIQNTKLNAIAERLDALTAGMKVAPPQKVQGPQEGKKSNAGRKKGSKDRPLNVQYAWLVERIQCCRPGSQTQKKYQTRLARIRRKLGMTP